MRLRPIRRRGWLGRRWRPVLGDSGLRRLATTAKREYPAGASRALPSERGIDLSRQLVEVVVDADLAAPPTWRALAWRRVCQGDRKSTRLNSSHMSISYAVFC